MLRSRPAEVDPLLPQTDPSPEIQSYGASGTKGSSEIGFVGAPPSYSDDEYRELRGQDDDEGIDDAPRQEPDTNASTQASAQGTIIVALTFGVFLFILYNFFNLGGGGGGHHSDQPAPILTPSPTHPRSPTNHSLDQRVRRILTDTPLIDGHNDLAIFIRGAFKNDIHSDDFRRHFEHGGLAGDVDLPRLKKGMVGGAFWSAFVVCPANASEDFSDAEYGTAVSHTLQQIDLIKRLQRMYEGIFTPAGTPLMDMLVRFRATRALISPVSIEGLHQVPQSAAMATLRLYYELGVRAATLTWNCHNAFADAALIWSNGTTTPSGYHRGGLTTAGRAVIKEMNRLGMLVDLSHTSYWTQKAVLSDNTSRAPVFFSHSSAFALCPHPRNVHDDILQLVRDTDSVVMVNFSPDFISCTPGGGDDDSDGMPVFYPANNTLHQIARHIVYIGDRIGYGHVGLGSDFDGMGELTPRGMDGVDKYPDLVRELLAMGVSDEDAAKVVGRNVLRVWHAVEDTARKMRQEGQREGEDDISGW